MPTTLTSQFALYQALFVKVSQSLVLFYKGIVYFLVFFFAVCRKDCFLPSKLTTQELIRQ